MERAYGARHGIKVYAAKTVQRERDQAGVMGALRSARRNTR